MWGLIWQIIKDIVSGFKNIFTSQSKIRSLEKENLALQETHKKETFELQEKYSAAQKEILSLQEKNSKYTQIDSLLNGLTCDTRIGIYRETTGIALCQKCIHTKKQKIPLCIIV